MKKLFALILCLCLLIPCASAIDLDLSSLSFDELRQLQDAINAEIVTRPEWQGVNVPKGVWKVGVDIPEGYYSIELQDCRDSCFIGVWGYATNDYKTNGGLVCSELLRKDAPILGKIELKNGYVVELGNPVIFKPAVKLGF